MNINLSVKLCDINLKNPTILSSGIMGVTGSSVCFVAENGAGAVTMKSIGLNERIGHKGTIIHAFEFGNINAVGLSCPDLDTAIKEIIYAKKNCSAPVIASIFAFNKKDYSTLTRRVTSARPDLIEVNISCPNVGSEGGKPFGIDPIISAEITSIVKKNTDIPVFVKLTPNTSDIVEIAKSVEDAGADGITAINTLGPGMAIDIESARPILKNKVGGMSGPCIRPIAIRCVYEIYKKVSIPIIGVGGITTGKDAIEMIMAGATAIGIGSGVYVRGLEVFKKITDEMRDFMLAHDYNSLDQIRGAAHEFE